MPLISTRFRSFLPAAGLGLALAGCSGGLSELGFDTKAAVGSVSLVDRCSDFMHRAYPGESITVSGTHLDTGVENMTVTVNGVRSGVPENSGYLRNVAVECRFTGGVLTGFRWTAGPIRSATPGQTTTGQAP
jgi:hypothetical protein